jgi:hypothetical protein
LAFVFVVSVAFFVCPFASSGLTFTLSDDAIMSLDFDYYDCGDPCAVITRITDVPGPGVRFDILFTDPFGDPYIQRISGIEGGKGILKGIDISRFDAFALKFTLLSARGVSSPRAIGPITVGAMINSPGYAYGFVPEDIAINDQEYPASATSVTTTDGAGQIELVGFTCYNWSYLYDDNWPNPWDPKGAKLSLLVGPADDAVILFAKPIDKCTVIAGKTKESSSISVSGKIGTTANDLLNDDDATIKVTLDSNDMSEPCDITFPIDNKGFLNNGKFTYSGTENGVKKSFKLDLKTHKFSFSAKNIDLSGLSCPFHIKIDINDYNTEADLDETIVNGPKKPIPINLLMGVKDSLRVDKIRVKYGPRKGTDQLSIKGGFAVQKGYVKMNEVDCAFSFPRQTFSLPAGSLKSKGDYRFICSNIKLMDGIDLIGIVSADFNFKTCTFTLTIRNASIAANPGDEVEFAVESDYFNAGAEVVMP